MKCNQTANIFLIDEENPDIMCPSDFNVITDAGLPTSFIHWTVTYIDNTEDLYDVTITGFGTSYNQSGEDISIGTTTLEYTATDAFGNSDNCTFIIVVRGEYYYVQSNIIRNMPKSDF